MDKILIGLLVLSQTMIFPNLSFRWCKELTAQMFILFAICYLVWKKNKWISAFMLWSALQFFIFKSLIINDMAYRGITFNINLLAFLNIINIILFGLFYYVLHEIKFDKKLIYKTLCFIAIFQAGYCILQKFQIDQFFLHTSSLLNISGHGLKVRWPVGMWANESLVSWCIVLCSPFFLAFKELKYKLGYVLCFIAILFTRCSVGILAFIVGFLFWLWFKNKKLAILIIVCILTIGCILLYNGKLDYYLSDTHRFQVWKKALHIWKDNNCIIGNGLGSFRATFLERSPEFLSDGHWAQAHNEYIQVLYEQGIIGFSIMLGLMWTVFYNFIKKKKGLIPVTSLLILSIIMLTGFPMRTAMGIIPLFALVFAEKELNEPQE